MRGKPTRCRVMEGEEEEDVEFFNHYKNDLTRHAHTPSGVAGADLKPTVISGRSPKDPHPPTAQPPCDVHDAAP